MDKTCAIVPAAGRGLRMAKGEPKQFLTLAGKPILVHTIEKLSSASFISDIVLVVPEDFLAYVQELVVFCCDNVSSQQPTTEMSQSFSVASDHQNEISSNDNFPSIVLIAGGKERQDSVLNALRIVPGDCDWVLIHDGVRPFVSLQLLEETWHAAHRTGAAIAAVSATDTIKRVQGQRVLETIPREEIKLVQTPQVFKKDLILSAYSKAEEFGWTGTDDCSFVERLNVSVEVVEGESTNIKVTTPSDLEWAAWFLGLPKAM